MRHHAAVLVSVTSAIGVASGGAAARWLTGAIR
jgi:hypothetical protein